MEETPENENPNKVIDIVEKILQINEQQNSRGLKIVTPKEMFQRLLIAHSQVKEGNTSKHLLNEILQIIYSKLKITKKVYNNTMNSINL